MTWLSTWPDQGRPTYRVHATEADAERHATDVVRRGDAAVATYFEMNDRPEETP